MFDSNKTNSSCEFGSEIISYLYGEMAPDERTDFETHLEMCLKCPEEVAAFSNVAGAITDWKKRDFDPLPSLKIEFPAAVGTDQYADSPRIGIWESVLGLLNGWQMASALGAVLLTIGLLWLFGGSGTVEKQVAEKTPAVIQTEPSEVDSVDPPAVEASDKTDEEIQPEIAASPKNPVLETNPPAAISEPRNQGTSKAAPTKAVNRTPAANPKKDPKPVETKVEPKSVPRLTELAETEDFDEDGGLRLTDLFAADTEEK